MDTPKWWTMRFRTRQNKLSVTSLSNEISWDVYIFFLKQLDRIGIYGILMNFMDAKWPIPSLSNSFMSLEILRWNATVSDQGMELEQSCLLMRRAVNSAPLQCWPGVFCNNGKTPFHQRLIKSFPLLLKWLFGGVMVYSIFRHTGFVSLACVPWIKKHPQTNLNQRKKLQVVH